MAVLLQLGAGEWMKHSIRLIQQMGHKVYAVDKNPLAPAASLADGFAAIDLIDEEGIARYAREISADAIFAANEAGALAASHVSQRLGLRGLAPDAAMRALDKGLMREAWAAAGLRQPRFMIVETPEEIPAAAEKIGYPVIVKPTMNWGSRGTSRANSPDEIQWSIDFAVQHRRTGRFIVEECINGTEMTIEGLAINGKGVILGKSDKEHQDHPRYRVAMGINYPANFSSDVLAQVDDLILRAAQALGIENGAIHCEAMVMDNVPYLIEMAGRPGGGHIFGQIVEATSGICMPQALAAILLGEQPDITPHYQRGACYRFFAPPPGVFVRVEGIEQARQIPGVLDLGFHMQPGHIVGAIAGDADRPGFCVTSAATRAEAMAIADQAVDLIHFIMDPLPG